MKLSLCMPFMFIIIPQVYGILRIRREQNDTNGPLQFNVSAGYGVQLENGNNTTPSSNNYHFQERKVKSEVSTPQNHQDQIPEPSLTSQIQPSVPYQVHEIHPELQEKSYNINTQFPIKSRPSIHELQNVVNNLEPTNNNYQYPKTSRIVEVVRVPAVYELHVQSDGYDMQRFMNLNPWVTKLNGFAQEKRRPQYTSGGNLQNIIIGKPWPSIQQIPHYKQTPQYVSHSHNAIHYKQEQQHIPQKMFHYKQESQQLPQNMIQFTQVPQNLFHYKQEQVPQTVFQYKEEPEQVPFQYKEESQQVPQNLYHYQQEPKQDINPGHNSFVRVVHDRPSSNLKAVPNYQQQYTQNYPQAVKKTEKMEDIDFNYDYYKKPQALHVVPAPVLNGQRGIYKPKIETPKTTYEKHHSDTLLYQQAPTPQLWMNHQNSNGIFDNISLKPVSASYDVAGEFRKGIVESVPTDYAQENEQPIVNSNDFDQNNYLQTVPEYYTNDYVSESTNYIQPTESAPIEQDERMKDFIQMFAKNNANLLLVQDQGIDKNVVPNNNLLLVKDDGNIQDIQNYKKFESMKIQPSTPNVMKRTKVNYPRPFRPSNRRSAPMDYILYIKERMIE